MRRMVVVVGLWMALGGLRLAAQEQVATLAGRVVDASGEPVAGAPVEVEGAAGRWRVESGEDGSYRLMRLPPGRVRLRLPCDGCTAEVVEVTLELGRDARVDLRLDAGAGETVAAREVAPGLDLSTAARTFAIGREAIETLPAGRDFTDLVPFAPGANAEREAGGLSIDGASGSENVFVIDGLDSTHPQTGVAGKRLPSDFVEEVQVKSAGYAAEFGGALGGVVNVVTRGGGSTWKGEVGWRAGDDRFDGRPRPQLLVSADGAAVSYRRFPRDAERRSEPFATAGGPLMGDRARLFVGADRATVETRRTVDFASGERRAFSTESTAAFLTANLTGNAGPRVLWRLAADLSPDRTERSLPDPTGGGSSDPADYRFGTENDNALYSASLDAMPADRWLLSLRGGRFSFDSHTLDATIVPFETQFGGFPSHYPEMPEELRRPPGWTSGPLYPVVFHDRFDRDQLAADATALLHGGGDHEVKLGVQLARVRNDVERTNNGSFHGLTWDGSDPFFGRRGRYGVLALENRGSRGRVESDQRALFVQDTWRPTSRLALDLGLRASDETVPDFRLEHRGEDAIHFRFGDELAPRLGFAWDVRGDGMWKAFGSAGRYFDTTKLQLARTSFGADRRVIYYYGLDTFDWPAIDCAVTDNDPRDPPDCGLPFLGAVDLRVPSNDAIDPAIRPTESREWQLGLEHATAAGTTASIRYLHREVVRTIEDIGSFDPARGAEIFVIGNPGEGRSQWAQPGLRLPKPVRDYDAVELTWRRPLRDRWSLAASYTWSRLRGNYPGLASSDEGGRTAPNIERAWDSWFNLFDQHGRPVEGPLGTDRPHQLKLDAVLQPGAGFTVGLHQYVASGTPRTTVAIRQDVPFYPYGRGNLGRNPTLTQTDLRLAWEHPIAKTRLELSVVVLNLFDEETVTDVYEGITTGGLQMTDEEFRNGFDVLEVMRRQGMPVNVQYQQETARQAARSVVWGVRVGW